MKRLTCARLEAWNGMINLVGKGVDVTGAEVQLAHANVVLILMRVHGR